MPTKFFCQIVSLVSLFLLVVVLSAPAAENPNVLFIVADDMNTDLACYGHPQVKTPNLDRLAERGVRFTNAYCQVPLCNPSRTSFLSGKYRSSPKQKPVYLPNHFQANGYNTVQVGKVAHGFGASQNNTKWEVSVRGAAKQAVEVLKQPRTQPLFLAIGLEHTHAGATIDRRFREFYDPKAIKPPKAADSGESPPIALTKLNRPERSEEEVRKHIATYYARISAADAEVGIVMKALDEQKLWDNTIVVFFSDHGMHLGQRGIFDKRSLYEPALAVPLIIVAPQVKPQISPRLAELVDLYPTLTQLCAIPAPDHLEGKSLVPLLTDPKSDWEDVAYSFSPMVRGARSIRTPRYRLTSWGPEGPLELFDYKTDPQEKHNLASDPEQKERVEELLGKLREKQRTRK